VGAEFLARNYPVKTVLLPSPTWPSHNKIFPLAGVSDVRAYRYFKPSTRGLDYEVCPGIGYANPSERIERVWLAASCDCVFWLAHRLAYVASCMAHSLVFAISSCQHMVHLCC